MSQSTIPSYSPRFDWETKTSEYSTMQRAMARATKWGRFGERKCFACDLPLNPRELHKSYSLHHEYRKGSPNYNLLIYVHLVHPGCHGRLGPAIEKAQPQKREREIPKEPGVGEPDRTDPSAYAVEKNGEEEAVREWAIEHLLKFGPDPALESIPYLQLRNMVMAAAEEFDFGRAALYHYFGRMLNPINGFLSQKRAFKRKYLGFRIAGYYELTPEQIARMHPKRGRAYYVERLGKP